ncbi:MAG: DUF2157 domain-containing protein [Gammaproteobacteria bacterium]|nr:DUF2157 domain-containing protein [Gammaproteobacteria bacterium]
MIWLLAIFVIFVLIGGGIWAWLLMAGILSSSVSDKPSALKKITQLMHRFDIASAEVETAFHASADSSVTIDPRSKSDIAKTLFIYLGAIFILAGISAYVGMFWDSMGSAMRVLISLGVGYILFIVLISALHEKKYPRLILPLTLAPAFVMTSGWFVLIHEVFPQGNNWRTAVLAVLGVMALHQGALFSKYRITVLLFTTLFFVYGFMQVGLDRLGIPITYIAIVLGASLLLVGTKLEETSHRVLAEPALLIAICWLNAGLFDFIAGSTSPNWAALIVGVSLMFTAYGLQKTERYPRLAGLGYFAGSIMLYSALFDLVYNTPLELLYLAATVSMLYVCVVLQSRLLLFTTVIAMLGFIGFYTAEHFANSLGWPVTLVLLGVIFLGVGTIAIKVRRHI